MKFLIAFAIASLLMVFIQIINALRRKPRTTKEKVSEFGTTATDWAECATWIAGWRT